MPNPSMLCPAPRQISWLLWRQSQVTYKRRPARSSHSAKPTGLHVYTCEPMKLGRPRPPCTPVPATTNVQVARGPVPVGAVGAAGALGTVILAGVLGGLKTVPAVAPALSMSTFPAVTARCFVKINTFARECAVQCQEPR